MLRQRIANINSKLMRKDDGQSLIQFALIVITLLAFVALAVDGGNAFSVRRKMQNAADASALAAAREICLGHTQAQAKTTANTYLVKNGAQAIGEISGSGSAITFSDSNSHIKVDAKVESGMIFGGLLKMDTIEVAATANASCGSAKSACNLWPIIFNVDLWKKIDCGKTIAVWDTNNSGQVECFIGGKYEPNLCKCYNCDSQNVGIDDFLVVSDVQRGWLDFPPSEDPALYPDVCKESGSGASELKCTLANNYQGRMTLPKWVDALNGVKASAFKEVDDRIGDTVRIPLYTALKKGYSATCYDKPVDEFNVTDFGCVQVEGVVKNRWLNPLPGMPKSYKKVKMTAIMVTKSCGVCTSACATTDGTPAQPWELQGASLTK